jgi:bifunctional DNA-binding transcriptional regulator/antitoxin component of YhaV-PrlF toxin-antitoxin module
MVKCVIKIPNDPKHKITIPVEVWRVENLKIGDYIEVDIKKKEMK